MYNSCEREDPTQLKNSHLEIIQNPMILSSYIPWELNDLYWILEKIGKHMAGTGISLSFYYDLHCDKILVAFQKCSLWIPLAELLLSQ